ncbi:MAG: LbtU family siderophore porin [Proteobacteria bacterium]|nr:LbtU family siderophore porin [Desulfobacula sp.]MBU3950624.1 LbtU family siderophore porin [Pseudomonadota bacterium]MBU4132580.1 LbtU family siderophore porin [Pseudomonadota bacterium]
MKRVTPCRIVFFLALFTPFLLGFAVQPALAVESDSGLEQRLLKIEQALGLQPDTASSPSLEQRISAIEHQLASAPKPAAPQRADTLSHAMDSLSDRITLSGALELDYSHADDADPADNTKNDSSSDLDIGTIELGLEARLHEYVIANVLLKGENLDSDNKIFWDEVFFTLARDNYPLYFVGGKRVQPFGAFESLFINDPITQDLYEINAGGATAGFLVSSLGLDISGTLYKGETLMNRAGETGYGLGRNPSHTTTNDVNSFIVNASLGLVDDMTVSAFFSSEPGDGQRNTTLGSAFHWEIAGFILDGEYIGALGRENHFSDNREYRENAWAASLGYQIKDPLLIAIRYESFDADKDQAGFLEYRYSLGATYTLFKDKNFTCNLMGEYRRSEYASDSSTDPDLNEFFTRLALEF